MSPVQKVSWRALAWPILLAVLSACGGGASAPAPAGSAPAGSGKPAASTTVGGQTSASASAGLAATGGSAEKPAASTQSAASPASQPASASGVAAKPSGSTPAIAAASGSAAPAGDDWPFYHKDLAHNGIGPTDPQITAPKQAWSTPVDGVVYGEPLVVGGRVFVVTENDTAYALNAADGTVAWQKHLGEPVPRSSLPCGNIDPSGMTATPAIANGVLYAVGRFQPTHHELWALDVSSGAEKFHRTIDPPGADPRYLQERSALGVANGRVYVPFGGNFGDCGPYKGWVVSAPPDSGTGDLKTWAVPTQREGAIWATPGATFDANGDLLVAIGNAESTTQFDYGNAVVRLSPDLQAKDYWAPSDWAALSAADRDIGSISPVVLQGNQVFVTGKNGVGYLLHTDKLGQIGGEAFKSQVCGAAFSGAAYQPPVLYVPCTDGVTALRIDNGSFQTAWRASGGGGPTAPIVAYGSVWRIDGNAPALLQLDPSSGQQRSSTPLPGPAVAHFLTPTAVGGKLYLTSGKNVLAFGQ